MPEVRPWRRKFWRALYRLRFRLWQQHRYHRLVLEWVAARPFLILPGVFNPALFLVSEFMVTALNETLVPPGSRALDMGTGCGIGAVFLAQWAAQVTAVDINPQAVRCAHLNALLNQVDNQVIVSAGDLFAPVAGQQFDVILFNPPYLRGQPRDMADRAFHATDVVERFAAQLGTHLTPTGHALLLLTSMADEPYFCRLFQQQGFTVHPTARYDAHTELVTLYQIS